MAETLRQLWSALASKLGGRRWLPFALAGLLLAALYGGHYYFCSRSALVAIPFVSDQSDMFANLNWSLSILNQGWLNPQPFHPYFEWMSLVGTPAEWLSWWGGEAVFQQSPLYAYIMALLFRLDDSASLIYLVNTLTGAALCVTIALVAKRMSGEAKVGWLALVIAALYSPFYAYSWPMLRDCLGWLVTAVALLMLLHEPRTDERAWRTGLHASLTGLMLGIGYLAKETFLLTIPLVLAATAILGFRSRRWLPLGCLVAGVALGMSPLLIRNAQVGAPLFSSSTRFAEGFIEGNVVGAEPNRFMIPREMRPIFLKSEGHALGVVSETLSTHPGAGSVLGLQFSKAVSLLDPFELCDNVNLYFMGHISPMVRWGLRHWMVIVPGLAGLVLCAWRGWRRQTWLWLFFLPMLAGVLLGPPLSRYRQGLMVLWIPWAAYFLWALWNDLRARKPAAFVKAAVLGAGWLACLTVFDRTPESRYETSLDYRLALELYQKAGDTERAAEMQRLIAEKFPGER